MAARFGDAAVVAARLESHTLFDDRREGVVFRKVVLRDFVASLLTGRKRWLLFPPGESRRLYPRGLFSGMPNFAAVDPEQPDLARHPRFAGARAVGATVAGGETLFIPHGWWHHTRSLDDAVAMNFWWGGKVVRLAALASTGFKRLRRIRRGEW